MTKYVKPKKLERPAKWDIGIVSNRAWLFQYRSCGQDLMVQLEASSLNDVLVLLQHTTIKLMKSMKLQRFLSMVTNNYATQTPFDNQTPLAFQTPLCKIQTPSAIKESIAG